MKKVRCKKIVGEMQGKRVQSMLVKKKIYSAKFYKMQLYSIIYQSNSAVVVAIRVAVKVLLVAYPKSRFDRLVISSPLIFR